MCIYVATLKILDLIPSTTICSRGFKCDFFYLLPERYISIKIFLPFYIFAYVVQRTVLGNKAEIFTELNFFVLRKFSLFFPKCVSVFNKDSLHLKILQYLRTKLDNKAQN